MAEDTEGTGDPEPAAPPTEQSWHARLRAKMRESPAVDGVLAGAKTVLEVGSDAADILVELGNGVTAPGVAALTLRGINTLRELRARSPAQHFADGWKPLSLHGLDDVLHESFAAQPGLATRHVPGMHDHQPAYTAVLDGVEFGWAVSDVPRAGRRRSRNRFRDDGESRVAGAWVREDQEDLAALRVLGRCVWKHLSSMRMLARNVRSEGLAVVPEPEKEVLPSKTGQQLYDVKLRRALEKGIHRSVFLIGDPGVGKSCMLRYVASLHGGLQLRFKLADMHDLGGSEIAGIVEVLRPDVLLIDDFDRFVANPGGKRDNSPKATGMLDPLEEINDLVPLFMVSANFNEGITKALLRPGRFDEIVVMDGLEPELYAKMLPGAPDKFVKAVQRSNMPMSHVFELRKRAEASGWDWVAARKELADLANRSDVVVELNKRSLRRAARKPAKLAGKSQRQKAAWLDRHAVKADKNATRLAAKSRTVRAKAEKARVQAAEWREKADDAEAKDKEKRTAEKKAGKKPRKTSSKKKNKKKNKTKALTKKAEEVEESTLRSISPLDDYRPGRRGKSKKRRRRRST